LDEPSLIQALKGGDPAAFATLMSTHADRVYNTVLSMLQNAEDAEDAAQETFISIHQNIKSFRGDAQLSTWIYRIAVTKALEALRRRSRRKERAASEGETAGMEAPAFHHPGVALQNKERAAVLFRAMQTLPHNQRAAFVLHKTEGLSYAEIAGVLEVSLSSVESLIYRARQNLQKVLAQYWEADKS
jgi:RNA polymerase sigma-70 factor (ECF subfamily)